MTTRSTDAERKVSAELGRALRVIASDTIFAGSAIGENGSGYMRPLVAGDPFKGFASEQCENESGSAGDKRVKRYVKGHIELSITGVTGVGDIGDAVYASDDDTFTKTESTNSFVGRIEDWISGTTAIVAFDATKPSLATLAELTGSAVGTANGAMEAFTNLNNLSTTTTGTANGQTEAVTTPTAITGTEGGTANGAWEDTSTVVSGVDGTGSNAASKADVDSRLASIANNFAEVEAYMVEVTAAIAALKNNQEEFRTELVAQRTWNSAGANNIEEVRARLDDLLRMLE